MGDLDYRVIFSDGSVRWIATRGKIICDKSGEPQYSSGVVWDVTESRLAQEEIRKSEELFRALNFTCPVGIFCADRNGRLEYANLRLAQICGIQIEEALGFGFQNCIHPDDRERTVREYLSAVISGKEVECECRVVHPDGSLRWVHGRAIVTG